MAKFPKIESPVAQFMIGLGLGLVIPIVFATIFYKTFYTGPDELSQVLSFFRKTNILTNLILVSMVPNFIAVFLCNMLEKWNYLRGVFVSIMVYLSIAFLI